MFRLLRSAATTLLAGALLLTLPTVATAEPPLDVTGTITDEVGVLDDDERADVQAALDDHFDATRSQLFVVYVDTFDGLSGADWAAQTAQTSGLGVADILLVVATQQRAYGFDVPDDISDADLERVEREFVLPALRDDDWDGAAVAAADGFTTVQEGVDIPWAPIALGGAAVLGAGAYGVYRTRRRYDHTHRVLDEHGNPVDPAAILTDEELEQAASTSLLEADDALRTAEQELGFAEAQFGAESTTALRAALTTNRERAREAFALHQRLDDAEPETDAARRRLCSQIIGLAERIEDDLDQHTDDIDRLRTIEADPDAALAAAGDRLDDVRARLEPGRSALAQLQIDHPRAEISAVQDNPTEADDLLQAATAALTEARTALPGDRPDAALHIRTAESAVQQAAAKLQAIDDLATGLATLDDAAARVNARLSAVQTFVETHRGAVGTAARTRLSEAERLLQSPAGAVVEGTSAVTRSEELVEEAQQIAEADVARFRADASRAADQGGARSGAPSGAQGGLLDALLIGGLTGPRRTTRGRSASRSWASSTSSRRSRSGTGSRSGRSRSTTRRRSSGGSARRSRGGRF